MMVLVPDNIHLGYDINREKLMLLIDAADILSPLECMTGCVNLM